MEPDLFNEVVTKLNSSSKHTTDFTKQFGLRVNPGSKEGELYRLRTSKAIVPKSREIACIIQSHRSCGTCLSIADTAIAISQYYEVSPEIHGIQLSLISSVIEMCPLCSNKSIKDNSPVLIRWCDGLVYRGTMIHKVQRVCLIQFEDGSTHAVNIKDVFEDTNGDIKCAVCRGGKSLTPNQIVLCDGCNDGFHQKCHSPPISDRVLQSSGDWFCTMCVKLNRKAKVVEPRPNLSMASLIFMALLVKGPLTKSGIEKWIQEAFAYYSNSVDDKWKARLQYHLSLRSSWVKYTPAKQEWHLDEKKVPFISRYISKAVKTDGGLALLLKGHLSGVDKDKPLVTTAGCFAKFLSYEVASLSWDNMHRINKEGVYCYCTGNGVWYREMLQCISCRNWFHKVCTTYASRVLLYGEPHLFICTCCNMGHNEDFAYVHMSLEQKLHLLMYHVIMYTFNGNFTLPVCLKMHVIPLLQEARHIRIGTPESLLTVLRDTAKGNPKVFETNSTLKTNNLFWLKRQNPPEVFVVKDPVASVPSHGSKEPTSRRCFIELQNETSGLLVNKSPPARTHATYGANPRGVKDTKAIADKSSDTMIDDPNRKRANIEDKRDGAAKKLKTFQERSALKSFKESMLIKRIESGEKFKIIGKGESETGKIRYLISWQGVTS